MIARIWHGRTRALHAERYLEFLNGRAVPVYRNTPGGRAAHILRRLEGGEAHFLLITLRESLDAFRAFACEEFAMAKYYPDDLEFLLEFEPAVQHCELYDSASGVARPAFVVCPVRR